MPIRRGGKAHTAIREACATIALAVSQTTSGAAHTVVLMLRNPDFRTKAIEDAKRRTDIYAMNCPTEDHRAAYDDVRAAAQILAPHTGEVL